MNQEKKQNLIQLVSQLLEKAEAQDTQHKLDSIKNHQAEMAVGESFWVFHLKEIKKALEED